jgi:hypothetical protein
MCLNLSWNVLCTRLFPVSYRVETQLSVHLCQGIRPWKICHRHVLGIIFPVYPFVGWVFLTIVLDTNQLIHSLLLCCFISIAMLPYILWFRSVHWIDSHLFSRLSNFYTLLSFEM